MNDVEKAQRAEEIKQLKHKMIDEHETIVFVIREQEGNGCCVTTYENPRMMIVDKNKFDTLCVAFTKYLERLNEMENPEVLAARLKREAEQNAASELKAMALANLEDTK